MYDSSHLPSDLPGFRHYYNEAVWVQLIFFLYKYKKLAQFIFPVIKMDIETNKMKL